MAEFIFVQDNKKKVYKKRSAICESDDKKFHRFDTHHIEWLSNYFLGNNEETRGGALSNEQKIRLYLRFCADPGFQLGIGEDIGVHQSTVSRTISEMAKVIAGKANDWINFPTTNEEVKDAQNQWQTKNCFPFAIGVIDCTHIKIKKPSAQSDEYICRKGFHSINVQATCDASEMFTSVDISWPGSVHDSRVLRNSIIYTAMQNVGNEALLLGDEGYALSTWLMTPFRSPSTDLEKNYNKVFTRERCVIEHFFGQLKQRFAVLQYKIRVSTELAPIVNASCFVLHNIAKYLKDEFIPECSNYLQESEFWSISLLDNEETNARAIDAAKRKRQHIAYLLT